MFCQEHWVHLATFEWKLAGVNQDLELSGLEIR